MLSILTLRLDKVYTYAPALAVTAITPAGIAPPFWAWPGGTAVSASEANIPSRG